MTFVWSSPGGKLLDKYILVGSNETVESLTVPTGKQWMVYWIFASRPVSATLNAYLYNSNDKIIGRIVDVAAGTSVIVGGFGQLTYDIECPFPMKAGDYIKFTYGAAQDATAYVGAVILEITI